MIARPVRRASVTVCLAALAAACGGQAATSSAGSDPPTVSRAADTTQVQQASCASAGLHTVQGGLLRMPANAQAGRTPLLLVVIPGGDGDADDRLGIGRAGNRQGVALLYPTSAGSGFWQLNRAFGTSDVDRRHRAAAAPGRHRLLRHEPDLDHGRVQRRRVHGPDGLRAADDVRRGHPGRRRLQGARPLPRDRARVVPRHPRDRRHRRADQRQEARPQGQRRPLHVDVGAARRLLREPEVEHAAARS